ncbi:MAG: hypothetical protein ACYC9O_05505 [Candidatus Latescibacterota bacterium]
MDLLMNTGMDYLQSYNWQSPVTFVFIALGILALLGRWGVIFMVMFTLSLGSIAHDLIVLDRTTSEALIGVPSVIYCLGGILIGFSLLVRFVRYMIL